MLQSFTQIAGQDLLTVSTTAKMPLGTLAVGNCFIDTTTANTPIYASTGSGANITEYDGNMYIYLKGVASTIAGSVVTYDHAGTTALATTSTTAGFPVAVACAATVASTYGWYLIGGVGIVAVAGSVVANTRLQTTATGGMLDDTTTANVYTNSIVARTASTAGAASFVVGQASGFPLANLAL